MGTLLKGAPQRGLTQDTKSDHPGVPWIPTGWITDGIGALTHTPPQVTFADPGSRVTEVDDLLLAIRGIEKAGEIGCSIVRFEEPAAYAQSLMRLRVKSEVVLADYLRIYLTSEKGRIALSGAATGTVISNVSASALQGVEVLLPDIETQSEIVATLRRIEAAVDQLRAAAQTAEDYYGTMKEGMTSGIIPPSGDLDEVEIQ